MEYKFFFFSLTKIFLCRLCYSSGYLCLCIVPIQLCDDKVEMSLPTSVLHCAILRLCIELDLFFANSTNQQMITEWKDFFCPAIGDATVVQFKHILKHSKLSVSIQNFSTVKFFVFRIIQHPLPYLLFLTFRKR